MHKRSTACCISVLVGLLIVSIPVSAHHGVAAYDMKTTLALKGTVTSFELRNPHSILSFDVKDDKGNVQHWSVETHNPRALVDLGWTKESLKSGDEVTVYLHPAKNGSTVGYLVKVTFGNGKELLPSAPE
jgi:hypothetical protein